MTNLSKQLCEICGIRVLYKIEDIKILQSETALHLINLARANTNYKDIGAEPVYPDFTQPDNFVKLLELRFTTKRGYIFTVVEALQNGRCFIFADRKSFLEQLLDYIFTCKNFGEYIKQAIRETEWVYG